MAYANMRGICRAEQKYMPFFGPSLSAIKIDNIERVLGIGINSWKNSILSF